MHDDTRTALEHEMDCYNDIIHDALKVGNREDARRLIEALSHIAFDLGKEDIDMAKRAKQWKEAVVNDALARTDKEYDAVEWRIVINNVIASSRMEGYATSMGV